MYLANITAKLFSYSEVLSSLMQFLTEKRGRGKRGSREGKQNTEGKKEKIKK
jgi:hypothetical protein